MFWLILVLLLIAAILGILGTVLKVAAVIVLSAILAIAIVGWIGWIAVKRQTRRYLQAAQGGVRGGRTTGSPGGGTVVDAEGRVVRPELPE